MNRIFTASRAVQKANAALFNNVAKPMAVRGNRLKSTTIGHVFNYKK
jgi:hypothetical protein